MVFLNLADTLLATGERAGAQLLLDEQIQAMEARRWGWTAGYMLCAHGRFALSTGDRSRARVLLEKALSLFDRLQDARGIARASLFLAQVALHQQDYTAAITMARRCLENAHAVDAHATIIGCLEELADVAIRRGKVSWAVQLWASGERQRSAANPHHGPVPPVERAELVASAREALGEEVFLETWEEGRKLPIEQLLSVEHIVRVMHNRPVKVAERPAGLTRRELDVLLLVAEGLSNMEIAERLVISPTTVVSYLNVIYRKLDVSSRTAAMRYVIDHRLGAGSR
jgi:ATP/maltotriose-dependent transcriptional regulator MalT